MSADEITVTFRQTLEHTTEFTLTQLVEYFPELEGKTRAEAIHWLREDAVNENFDAYDELAGYMDHHAEVADDEMTFEVPKDEDDTPTIRQTLCGNCFLEVEGPIDDQGRYHDRGGNVRCSNGKPHVPVQGPPPRNV